VAGEWQHIDQYFTVRLTQNCIPAAYLQFAFRLLISKKDVLKGAGIWLNVLSNNQQLYATAVNRKFLQLTFTTRCTCHLI